MFGSRKKTVPIDTLVGRNSRVDGDIRYSGGLHVDGYVKGNVRAMSDSESLILISERGVVEGSVSVPEVILHGTIKGDVVALDRIVLGSDARVMGDVYYNLIEMTIGAEVNGKLVHQPAGSTPLLSHQAETAKVEDRTVGSA